MYVEGAYNQTKLGRNPSRGYFSPYPCSHVYCILFVGSSNYIQ